VSTCQPRGVYKGVTLAGFMVMGGKLPLGGPAWWLWHPEQRLFVDREEAVARAEEVLALAEEESLIVAPTDDWWVEAIYR
jgi:hypothetical protein